ncbi:(4Fe-4S)-binding protein [candidate division WOR-3 bacterium RBG_13_43_14]|uniref:(4Fe-4S)-binding protein n=1 Tax=candidate division WOR-3 bacterium RBG_13_43_14 TaxID=1802590 RepID=A0A1F4UA80_UNCW3|nr:MAG: (4Fe-4S)-binding protein [candidate division WOR-3 bacterium RBG_13_43_14]
MIIAFASGKGGTGKTTVATNFALALDKNRMAKIQFIDCDVEEPNAAIFLKPKITNTRTVSIPVPTVDTTKCNYCGQCAEICAYHAIAVLKEKVLIFPELCHGCGGCSLLCPTSAIHEINREIGVIESGMSGGIIFYQGRLNVGEPMATPIIKQMKKILSKTDRDTTIIDVPPGTSCPVIEAVQESDFTVLVTEPTPFGLHDLSLAVETMEKLNIPAGIIVNRSDQNDKIIENFCKQKKIPILMRIPFSREFAVAYSKGIPLIDIDSSYQELFRSLRLSIQRRCN